MCLKNVKFESYFSFFYKIVHNIKYLFKKAIYYNLDTVNPQRFKKKLHFNYWLTKIQYCVLMYHENMT